MKVLTVALCMLTLTCASIQIASGAMPIPANLKKTVCFVFIEKEGQLVPNGTAFFIGIDRPDKTSQCVYLVTAKHVLQSSPEQGAYFPRVTVRLMKREGGVQQLMIPITTEGKEKNVFVHADDTVDLVVIPVLPKPELFDFKVLPASFLVDRERFKSLNVVEGTDIFFTGMFVPHLGKEMNYPVVRFGKVALLSEERIQFQHKLRELYLVETFSFGGNSGAPTFVYLGQDRTPGSIVIGRPEIKLAGVMSGTYQGISPIREIPTDTAKISMDNMGIAAVVPCYLLRDILLGDELKNRRGF